MPEKKDDRAAILTIAGAALGLGARMVMRLPMAGLAAEAVKTALDTAAPHLEQAEIRALSAARLLIDLRLAALEKKRGDIEPGSGETPGGNAAFTTIEIE